MTAVGVTGNNCFPEAPDITVNNTTVEIGDTAVLFVEDRFTIANSTGGLGLAFTLTATPYSAAAVWVFKQGSLGTVTTDFTRSGTALTLTAALATGETLVVKYMQAVT
jgi:hypothetical protein